MAKSAFPGSLLLVLTCSTCLISVFPSTLASHATSVAANIVFREKPEGMEEVNFTTIIRTSAKNNAVMGTVLSISTNENNKGSTRTQRAVPGCENLNLPYKSSVLSMKIDWNAKDSYAVHGMCKAVYLWTESDCRGYGLYWTVPGGKADPKIYDYQVYYIPQITGVYSKPKSILCELETAATPRPSSPPPQKGGGLGCVAPHNTARSLVGLSGLRWDTKLTASAQRWANVLRDNSCGFYHSGGPYGENLYKIWGAKPTCGMAVQSWVDEKPDYDYNSNTCKPGKMCGHYTQIIWRDTTKVGCARSTCSVKDNIYIWVCQYDPPGNYVGERPY